MNIYDKKYIINTFELENDLNILKELEFNESFHKSFEEWSEMHEKWAFEDLEEYAKEWFNKNKIN